VAPDRRLEDAFLALIAGQTISDPEEGE
jgi:hypothetical protein